MGRTGTSPFWSPFWRSAGPSVASFPRLITAYEHEVWVGFLAGEPLGPTDEAQLACLADFCAHVCRLDATRAELSETAFP